MPPDPPRSPKTFRFAARKSLLGFVVYQALFRLGPPLISLTVIRHQSDSRRYFFRAPKVTMDYQYCDTCHASDETVQLRKKFCVLTAGVHLREETKKGETEDLS